MHKYLYMLLRRNKPPASKPQVDTTGVEVVLQDGKSTACPQPIALATYDPRTGIITNIRWYPDALSAVHYVGGPVSLPPLEEGLRHGWEGTLHQDGETFRLVETNSYML